jgi:hypothetical protein
MADQGDSGTGFFAALNDPSALPLLGLIAGLGQASAPSRLPVTRGQVFGALAGGLMNGIQEANQARLAAAQAQGQPGGRSASGNQPSIAAPSAGPGVTLNDLVFRGPWQASPAQGQLPGWPAASGNQPSLAMLSTLTGLAPAELVLRGLWRGTP